MAGVRVIGRRVVYWGKRHPYLDGREVEVVAIHIGGLIDPDAAVIVRDDAELAAHGGIDPSRDWVEVASVIGNRASFVTSDVLVSELPGLLDHTRRRA